MVSGNYLTVGSSDVSVKEDSKAGSIDVTLGSGSAGAGVLAASVITLRRHYNNKVNLSGNTITSKDNFNVLNSLEGKTNLRWLLPAELQLMRTPKSRAALRRSGKATFPEELNSKSQSLTAVKMRAIRRKRINLKRPIPYLRLRRKINQKSI